MISSQETPAEKLSRLQNEQLLSLSELQALVQTHVSDPASQDPDSNLRRQQLFAFVALQEQRIEKLRTSIEEKQEKVKETPKVETQKTAASQKTQVKEPSLVEGILDMAAAEADKLSKDPNVKKALNLFKEFTH